MISTPSFEAAEDDMLETFGQVPPPLDMTPADDAAVEWPFSKKYTGGESAIPAKYRELIGLAVAANIKCPYCAHFHREAATMHGATDAELEEVYSLSSLTPRYSAMLHAQQYDLETFEDRVAAIADHLQAGMAAGD